MFSVFFHTNANGRERCVALDNVLVSVVRLVPSTGIRRRLWTTRITLKAVVELVKVFEICPATSLVADDGIACHNSVGCYPALRYSGYLDITSPDVEEGGVTNVTFPPTAYLIDMQDSIGLPACTTFFHM